MKPKTYVYHMYEASNASFVWRERLTAGVLVAALGCARRADRPRACGDRLKVLVIGAGPRSLRLRRPAIPSARIFDLASS